MEKNIVGKGIAHVEGPMMRYMWPVPKTQKQPMELEYKGQEGYWGAMRPGGNAAPSQAGSGS